MHIKPGVTLTGLNLKMRKVLKIADKLWNEHGQELTITSGTESHHTASSYHTYGYAVDLRSRYFNPSERQTIADQLQYRLGSLTEYTVVNESDHIHVQYNADSFNNQEQIQCLNEVKHQIKALAEQLQKQISVITQNSNPCEAEHASKK